MTTEELQSGLEKKRVARGIRPQQTFGKIMAMAALPVLAETREPEREAPNQSDGLGGCQCDGLGWILRPDGGAGIARPCPCRRPDPADVLARSGLPAEFNPPARGWDGPATNLKSFPGDAHCLTLWGKTGRGKSRVAADFMADWVRSGKRARWWKVADLLAAIKDSWDADEGIRGFKITGELAAVDLLVLDDIFAEQDTPWAGSETSRFVARRISDRKPTIFTTNIDPAAIAKIEPRLYSRLWDTDAAQIEMGGPDWRLL